MLGRKKRHSFFLKGILEDIIITISTHLLISHLLILLIYSFTHLLIYSFAYLLITLYNILIYTLLYKNLIIMTFPHFHH
jgi:hypothetical protein